MWKHIGHEFKRSGIREYRDPLDRAEFYPEDRDEPHQYRRAFVFADLVFKTCPIHSHECEIENNFRNLAKDHLQ